MAEASKRRPRREVITIDDKEPIGDQSTEKNVKREAEDDSPTEPLQPVPSPEMAEVLEKLRKAENDRQKLILMSAELQARVNLLEDLTDTKLEAGGTVKVAQLEEKVEELEKSIVYMAKELEEERNRSSEDRKRALEDRMREHQRIDELTRKLAQYEGQPALILHLQKEMDGLVESKTNLWYEGVKAGKEMEKKIKELEVKLAQFETQEPQVLQQSQQLAADAADLTERVSSLTSQLEEERRRGNERIAELQLKLDQYEGVPQELQQPAADAVDGANNMRDTAVDSRMDFAEDSIEVERMSLMNDRHGGDLDLNDDRGSMDNLAEKEGEAEGTRKTSSDFHKEPETPIVQMKRRSSRNRKKLSESVEDYDGENEPVGKKKKKKNSEPVNRRNEGTAQCFLCEKYPETTHGYAGHLRDGHGTTLTANGMYIKCACGAKVLAHTPIPHHHTKECDYRQFTLHNRADDGIPKCILCEKFPSTLTGYTEHLNKIHSSTLNAVTKNGSFLLCDCGFEIRTNRSAYNHIKECDRRQFSLHKMDE